MCVMLTSCRSGSLGLLCVLFVRVAQVGLVTQVLIVHCVRTEKVPFLQSRANPRLSLMSVLVGAVGLALPYIPGISGALHMRAPPASFFIVVAGTCLVYALLVLIAKKIFIRVFKQWL